MTGKGHRWTGIGAAFAGAALGKWLGLPEVPLALAAGMSTTMPDWSEIPFYRAGRRVGSLITHRTLTHWPILWLALAYWGWLQGGNVGALAVGAALGSFVHILGDAPNPMGIPWLLPTRRIKVGRSGLWSSGENEPLMILAFAGAGIGLWHLSGGEFPSVLKDFFKEMLYEPLFNR